MARPIQATLHTHPPALTNGQFRGLAMPLSLCWALQFVEANYVQCPNLDWQLTTAEEQQTIGVNSIDSAIVGALPGAPSGARWLNNSASRSTHKSEPMDALAKLRGDSRLLGGRSLVYTPLWPCGPHIDALGCSLIVAKGRARKKSRLKR